jgi:polar amino acid transport system substrate-binding protein
MSLRLCALLLSALLALPELMAAEAQDPPRTVLLAIPENTAQSFQGPWLRAIYREAFRRLGVNAVFATYPAKRASAMADTGRVDGELNRVELYGAAHPDLIRVEESHYSAHVSVYTADKDIHLADSWDALKGTNFRIEYGLGSAIVESRLPLYVAPQRLSTMSDVVLSLHKLELGRMDLLINGDLGTDPFLTLPEFRNSPIRKIANLEEGKVYAYLNKKHRALAVALAKTLAQMKREGLIDKFKTQAIHDWNDQEH